MQNWWNNQYRYRYSFEIDCVNHIGLVGDPVTVELPYTWLAYGKVNPDFSNVEVVGNAEQPLYRDIIEHNGKAYVTFQLQEEVEGRTEDYFIYYGGNGIINPETRISLIDLQSPLFDDFVNAYAHLPDWAVWPRFGDYSSKYISYSRPGEHWRDGVSSVGGARCNVLVEADRVRLLAEFSTEGGMATVAIDNSNPDSIDTFSHDTKIKTLAINELSDFKKEISVQKSRDSKSLSIAAVQYAPIKFVDYLREEASFAKWSSYIGG